MPKKKTDSVNKSFDFFSGIKTGNKEADGELDLSTKTWIDSGSYALNALLSGDMTKGFPNNRATMLAGEMQVGKSFLAGFGFARPLAEMGYFTFYIDSEGSLGDENIRNFGLKDGQFKIIPEDIVEELRITLNNIINQVEKAKGSSLTNEMKCAFVLDSQGMLDTMKSRSDLDKGDVGKTDLTLQKELKKMYKAFIKRMAVLEIPMLITNHVYKDNMSIQFVKPTVVAGGQGGLYAASSIITLRKRQFSVNKVRKGTLLIAKIAKSRTCQDNLEAHIYLDFEKGLNKWYGIHQFAEKVGLIYPPKGTKAEENEGIIVPDELKDSKGKFNTKTEKDVWCIRDPKKEPKDWIICKATDLHKKKTIGTIFDEINEYVKDSFKLKSPVDFDYDDDWEEDIDDATDETAEVAATEES